MKWVRHGRFFLKQCDNSIVKYGTFSFFSSLLNGIGSKRLLLDGVLKTELYENQKQVIELVINSINIINRFCGDVADGCFNDLHDRLLEKPYLTSIS